MVAVKHFMVWAPGILYNRYAPPYNRVQKY